MGLSWGGSGGVQVEVVLGSCASNVASGFQGCEIPKV